MTFIFTIDFFIGAVGMFFILLAFILDEFVKRFNQNTIQYNLTNIIGSGLLAYYAYTSKVWPFLILNSVWFIVAAYKIILIKTAPHKVKKKHK